MEWRGGVEGGWLTEWEVKDEEWRLTRVKGEGGGLKVRVNEG